MIWGWFDTWVVLTGALCAVSCALLGSFLVLRKMSMMGDAISHAVLPGIVVGFMVSGSRASLPMFIGAAVVGVLTAVLTQWVSRSGKVEESASMGVVFTGLFAVGLVLIKRAADMHAVDLDPGCVLYGALEMTPLDTLELAAPREVLGVEWSGEVPRPVLVLSAVLALNLVCILGFYKELKITSFDPALATTLGIPASVMHYLLMTLVAVTTVASFESVGSILVVAMLIVPAAAAHLLTNRLPTMLAIAALIGAASAVMGQLGAVTIPAAMGYPDTRIAGMMALSAGLLLALAVAFSPTHGLVIGWARRLGLSVRIAQEDVLGVLYRIEEARGVSPSPARDAGPSAAPSRGAGPSVSAARGAGPGGADENRTSTQSRAAASSDASRGVVSSDASRGAVSSAAPRAVLAQVLSVGPLRLGLALRRLRARGDVRVTAAGYELTESGRVQASQIIRTHRLWESFLARHLNLASDHVHTTAERLEHVRTPAVESGLAASVNAAEPDPQGKPIPEKRGEG